MRKWIVLLLTLSFCAAIPAQASATAPPTIHYFGANPIRNHEAVVKFSVDPEGLATEFELEYGSAPGEYITYTHMEGNLPAGDDPVVIEWNLPAYYAGTLDAGKDYYWTVVAKNAAGTTAGPEQKFTTTNGPRPGIVTGSPTEQTLTSARFSGTVDPEGFPLTGCRFRYVDENVFHYAGFEKWAGTGMVSFGRTAPCEESLAEIGSGNEPVAVHADVSGLEPGPYRFRLEAENGFEDAAGGNAIFGPSVVRSSGVVLVEPTEATVEAQLRKHWPAAGTQYRVEYETGGVWRQTAWTEATIWEYPEVSVALTCLQPSSEYDFRFAVASQAGTALGPEQSFETPAGTPGCLAPLAAPAPQVAAAPQGKASSVTQKPRKKKYRKHQRKRVRHNTTIVALR